jgi:hypothetical protein
MSKDWFTGDRTAAGHFCIKPHRSNKRSVKVLLHSQQAILRRVFFFFFKYKYIEKISLAHGLENLTFLRW